MYQQEREALVRHLRARGICNEAVLDAIAKVPRHLFVSEHLSSLAYQDTALAIGSNQTISQPFIVALMTQVLLGDQPLYKVLEVGTGSGYQAAILSYLCNQIYTLERIKDLYETAEQRFTELGYSNISCLHADGNHGWLEHSPYDGIIVTAAAPKIPKALLSQLADGARLVIPVGEFPHQELRVITKQGENYDEQILEYVLFVPLLKGKQE